MEDITIDGKMFALGLTIVCWIFVFVVYSVLGGVTGAVLQRMDVLKSDYDAFEISALSVIWPLTWVVGGVYMLARCTVVLPGLYVYRWLKK